MNDQEPIRAADALDWLHEQGKRRAGAVPQFDVEKTLRMVVRKVGTDPITSPGRHEQEPPTVDFLASLTPDELRALISVATERTFPRGSKLMREGDRAEYVMVIIDGWTRISVQDGDRDRIVAERGPGNLIGEVRALRVSVRSATVTALDTVRALVMRTEDFTSYLGAHQRVLALVESQVGNRLTEEPYRWDSRYGGLPASTVPPHSLWGENCTVIFTDMVGFGAPERSDQDRRVVRTAHRDMLQRSLGSLWDKCIALDQGDGLLIVAPPAISTSAVMECLHRELPRELRRYNRASDRPTRIRLRAAANVGPVAHDTVGLTGEALIRAARLLDAPVLRTAMTSPGTYLGLIVSPFVYDTAILPAHGWATPDAYRRVVIHVKESRISAWMGLFGAPSPVPGPHGP